MVALGADGQHSHPLPSRLDRKSKVHRPFSLRRCPNLESLARRVLHATSVAPGGTRVPRRGANRGESACGSGASVYKSVGNASRGRNSQQKGLDEHILNRIAARKPHEPRAQPSESIGGRNQAPRLVRFPLPSAHGRHPSGCPVFFTKPVASPAVTVLRRERARPPAERVESILDNRFRWKERGSTERTAHAQEDESRC